MFSSSRIQPGKVIARFPQLWPVILYGVLVFVVTWPVLPNVARAIPQGSEPSKTVPLFSLWILGWNVDRIEHGYQDYWDAPIFHPVTGTFAFSEPQPLAGLLAFPFWRAGPETAYNAVLFGYLLLNALAAFTLLRWRNLERLPSILGGALILFLPFFAQEQGVLPLLPVFGILLAIAGLWALAEHPRPAAVLAFGFGIGLTGLTNGSYLLFLFLMLLPALPLTLIHFQTARASLWAGAGLLLAATLIVPVAIPQLAILEELGFSRRLSTIGRNSASLSDYLRPASQLWQSAWFRLEIAGRQRLFPGLMLTGMALAGAYTGLHQRRFKTWTLNLIGMAALAFILSLGPNLTLGDRQPYLLLVEHIPGFGQIRSPFRLALFFQIGMALLSTLFLNHLWVAKRRLIVLLLFSLMLVEQLPRPARLVTLPEPLPVDLPNSPAVFLPWPEDGSVKAHEDTAALMARTIGRPIPLANGYSSNFPGLTRQLRELLADFPSPEGLSALRAIGVDTVIIRSSWLDKERSDRLDGRIVAGDLRPVSFGEELLIYRLTKSHLLDAQLYQGVWDYRIEVTEKALDIEVNADILNDQFFIVAPRVAPIRWEATLTYPDGRQQQLSVSPRGALLQYRQNRRWLRLQLPAPAESGEYLLELSDVETGEKILTSTVLIP